MNINMAGLTTPEMILAAGIILLVAAVIVMMIRSTRTARLRKKFGEIEYELAVAERGDRMRAEALLERREKRVGAFNLRALSPGDRVRFEETWAGVQAHFVDAPAGLSSRRF
jgi:hypothetical protein